MGEQVLSHCSLCGLRRRRVNGTLVCGHCDKSVHPSTTCGVCLRHFGMGLVFFFPPTAPPDPSA